MKRWSMPVLPTRRLFVAAAIAALSATIASAEQSQPVATAAVVDPIADLCAAAPVVGDEMTPILDRFFVPGKPFTLAGIPPASLKRAMDIQTASTKQQVRDWPNLCKYRAENAAVAARRTRPKVVFLGDSITEFWKLAVPSRFDEQIHDRGVAGQTTPQILLRFYPDVVALHPRVVHILAGTNDLAGNTGPESDETIIDNIRAMIDLAKANGIKVVLASITPTSLNNKDRPGDRIVRLNGRLRALAGERGAIFVDYYAKLALANGAMNPALANDGLHPNRDGYAVMQPLTERALAQALR